MNLLIISHTPHYKRGSTLTGWGSTIREISYLAGLFDQVIHVAPLYKGPSPESALPYTAGNVSFEPLPVTGGNGVLAKGSILAGVPTYWRVFDRAYSLAGPNTAVHIRCPANVALVGLAWIAFRYHRISRNFTRETLHSFPLWIKYAGNWSPPGSEPLSYSIQRWWLRAGLHSGVVTVNGDWPGQPQHVQSFYNPSLTQDEMGTGGIAAQNKELTHLSIEEPLRLLFVGRVEEAKGVDRVLRVTRQLAGQNIPVHLDIVGDGPQRVEYEAWAAANLPVGTTHFWGWQSRPELAKFYTSAHFLLFPSLSEGWPKVISEGMAAGVVPIAGAVSSIPQVLASLGCGTALPLTDEAFTEAIMAYIKNPQHWSAHRDAAVVGAVRFSYPAYLNAVKNLFYANWNICL